MTDTIEKPKSRGRRTFVNLVRVIGCVVLLAAVIGFIARDRTAWSQWLFFIPLAPVGLGCVLVDVLLAGRTLKPRFAFLVASAAATGLGASSLMNWSTSIAKPTFDPIRLVHWNVLWGGGDDAWPGVAAQIGSHAPDVVVLSEAANHWQIESDLGRHGLANHAFWQNEEGEPYTFRLAVASRWKVNQRWTRRLSHGRAMLVDVEAPGRIVRVLVLDGLSTPRIWRVPLLREVSSIIDECDQLQMSIDVVAGDFNTMRRSVGFDLLRDRGYESAADQMSGWRGTFFWPLLPFWEIDHVFHQNGWEVSEVRRLSNRRLDHVGKSMVLSRQPR
jgi:endonuclease/exonuclease/phosphatase (EEP) superfamily protein YafD